MDREQFLVMEYVEGVSLSYLVDTQNEVMQKHRLKLMIELGEARELFSSPELDSPRHLPAERVGLAK